MKIDPKQIAKMITEDPDEINPLDNIIDEFGPTCDVCGNDIEVTNLWWLSHGLASASRECEYCNVQICGSCAHDLGQSTLEKIGPYNNYSWYIPDDGLDSVSCVCPNCLDSLY